MPRFTNDQRLFCYKLRIKGEKYPQIARQLVLQFPNAPVPHRNAVRNLDVKMEAHKLLINRHRENSGRHRDERSDENILRVYESWMDDSEKSIRVRVRELQDLSRSTIQRILRLDLQLYPYLITRRHGLQPSDYPIRVQFADWFLAQHNLDDDFINNIWWTDESHIYLNGYVNTHKSQRHPLGESAPDCCGTYPPIPGEGNCLVCHLFTWSPRPLLLRAERPERDGERYKILRYAADKVYPGLIQLLPAA